MKKTNSKQTKATKSTKEFAVLKSNEFGNVRVVSDISVAEGYISFVDLCNILEVSAKEAVHKLSGHISVAGDLSGDHPITPYVDESGLYMMYLMSKKKEAIRFQDWLHEEFLQALYDQRKALAGLKKDAKLVVESNQQLQALRYMATAKNVAKSGHFKVGKDIPDLTMAHLRGWWYNPNDKSTFVLQFNCKTDCYIYENLRMNVYLKKHEDGNTEACDMLIKFLDLDDDNLKMMSYDTWLPEFAVADNIILDYLLEEITLDDDYLEPENIDVLVILNSIVSFHRSRRLENTNNKPLIEFV